jgi:molecular chaperone GrpE
MSDADEGKKVEDIEYIVETPPAEKKQEAKEAPPAEIPAAGGNTEALKPEGEEGRHLKARLKKRDAEIKQLKKEKEELRDQMLRKLAETDNLRKRLEREKTEFTQFALNDLLLEFLDILDNFERALSLPHEGTDDKSFRNGVELIYRMCQSLLARKGVQPIEIKDKTFDPNLHHAMVTEESDEVKEPQVGQELQKGYMIHSRLLRPAMVKVIIPKKKGE